MTYKVHIDDPCPMCDSPDYHAKKEWEHLGTAKLEMKVTTLCPNENCDFSKEYSTSLSA